MTRQHRLDPAALAAAQWRDGIANGVTVVLLLAIGLAVPVLVDWRWIIVAVAGALLAVSVCWAIVVTPRAHRSFLYRMGGRSIEVSSGMLVRSLRCIPYEQVLVVERRDGPILRRYGLVGARLTLPAGSVDIVGIRDDAFEVLRDAVERAHADG